MLSYVSILKLMLERVVKIMIEGVGCIRWFFYCRVVWKVVC